MTGVCLPCLICGIDLPPAVPDEHDPPPANAVAFTAHGNYGSTIFDPMNDDMLRVNICDPCLTAAAANNHVLHIRPDLRPRPPESARPYNPNNP